MFQHNAEMTMAHMLQLIRTMGRGDYLKDLGKKGQSAAMARSTYEPRKSLSPRSPKKPGDYLKDLGRKGMAAQLDDPAPRAASRAARARVRSGRGPVSGLGLGLAVSRASTVSDFGVIAWSGRSAVRLEYEFTFSLSWLSIVRSCDRSAGARPAGGMQWPIDLVARVRGTLGGERRAAVWHLDTAHCHCH